MKRILALCGTGRGPLVALPEGQVTVEVSGSKGPVKITAGKVIHEFDGDGEHEMYNPGFVFAESDSYVHCTIRTD